MSSTTPPRTTRLSDPVRRVLAVLGGGLAGSAVRTGVGHYLDSGTGFPAATLLVNLSGSLLLGYYLARREAAVTPGWSLQFWAIGLFGSLTTFSGLSIEVVRLLESGATAMAGLYVGVSLVGGLVLASVGQRVGMSR